MNLLKWLNSQILRMDWLSNLTATFVEQILGLNLSSRVGASVHFFIYDVIKIFILLSVLIFTISWIQSYFPPQRTKKILGSMRGIKANIAGALMGTITPFCSCSSIPLFMGFTSAGLPIGVTFSFLISSPFVDLASVILIASIFNWAVALVYVVIGIALAVIGGTIISGLKMDRYIEEFIFNSNFDETEQEHLSSKQRFNFAIDQVIDVIQRVWIFIIVGVGIGAAIHNWIPQEVISSLLGKGQWWSVIVATLAGIPMYADIFGTLPIAEAFVEKGVGLGTSLAFMMSVTALSLPSIIMLKKVVKTPLLILFVTIVTVGIIAIGYLFNLYNHFLLVN